MRMVCRAPGAGAVTRLGLEEHKIFRQADEWERTEGVCVWDALWSMEVSPAAHMSRL